MISGAKSPHSRPPILPSRPIKIELSARETDILITWNFYMRIVTHDIFGSIGEKILGESNGRFQE